MKPEKFTARVFIFVIIAFMLLSVYGIGARTKKLIDTSKAGANIEWEKLYPFYEESEKTKSERFSPLMNLYRNIKNKLELYVSEKMPGYYSFVEAAKKYEDVLKWNMVSVLDYNAVVRLKDGYLTSYTPSLDVRHDAEAVKGLADFCAGRGIDFAYINFPAKICKSEDRNISGILDFTNQNADKLLAMLRESGVRHYDFRENLHKRWDGRHHAAFFVTDLHWKSETGLWAAGEILKILRDDFGYDVNPAVLSPENFEYVVYPASLLGSEGKKVTLARAKPEDFTVIYPKFATALNVEVPMMMLNISGDFRVTYDVDESKMGDYYGGSPGILYNHGNNPLVRIKNMNKPSGKKIIFVHDSFSHTVIPFAALELQHVDAVDLRQFTGSLRRFIEQEEPDAVIVEYYSVMPGKYSSPNVTNEDQRLYNFQ